jgi:hypothetical protein
VKKIADFAKTGQLGTGAALRPFWDRFGAFGSQKWPISGPKSRKMPRKWSQMVQNRSQMMPTWCTNGLGRSQVILKIFDFGPFSAIWRPNHSRITRPEARKPLFELIWGHQGPKMAGNSAKSGPKPSSHPWNTLGMVPGDLQKFAVMQIAKNHFSRLDHRFLLSPRACWEGGCKPKKSDFWYGVAHGRHKAHIW